MHVDGPIRVGVISGLGQSERYSVYPAIDVETPYGPTSSPVRVATLHGQRVALIARRGTDDELQPHLVPNRANIWALASLGVRVLISSTASSGLRDAFSPGTFVITDQLIDLTNGRNTTFFDEGPAVQLPAAELFDRRLRALAVEVMHRQGVRVVDFGTTVVINGPRFSTAAESRWHAAIGGDLVNMTLMPETGLARELGMAVLNVSTITDRDAGTNPDHTDATNLDHIRRRSAQAQSTLLAALNELVPQIPDSLRGDTAIPQERIDEVLARPVARAQR